MRSQTLANKISITVVALVAIAACSSSRPDASVSQVNVVFAGGESLQGERLDEHSAITVFRGIPYAAPPVGDRRWRPPIAHVPRAGKQYAIRFAPACPQLQGNHDWYRRVATLLGNPPETIGPLEHIAEDCLYLNVWTNALPPAEKKPVMVWFHGGSNINGYANEPNYLGHNIASRDIVYVSFNYRLGVLGFMAHPGLSAESPLGVSGNYALLDQIAALRWIQDNIEAFGGDPDNVTVIGNSSGGYNIAWLIASPLAGGLFHRAIIQSGGWAVNSFVTMTQAESDGVSIASSMGFGTPLGNIEIIDSMRELDWLTIVSGAAKAYSGWYDAVVDDYLLTQPAAEIFAQGTFNNVDLLIGANENERYMYLADDVGANDLTEMIATLGGPYEKELAEALENSAHPNIRRVMDRLGSRADGYLCASRFIATSMVESANNVYFYYFTRIRPGAEKILAYHGAEIPYVFGTADDWLPADAIDHQLSDMMMRYWVNYAATGSPNDSGLPDWPAYAPGSDHHQQLGDTITSETNLDSEVCAILDRRRQDRLEAVR